MQLKKQADDNRPAPRYFVQDLAARFGVSFLTLPVARPELNSIEMVWGTTKMALKSTNTSFSLVTLRALAEVQFAKRYGRGVAAVRGPRYQGGGVLPQRREQ